MIATKQEQTTTSRILLVEDDRNFGDVLRSYLEMHGFTVDLAVDGIDHLCKREVKPDQADTLPADF